MLYFCPVHGKWFESLADDNLSYSFCRPQGGLNIARDGRTIIDLWKEVTAPPVPELKSTAVDPKSTALLILDMETSICKSPRCIKSIPYVHGLLTKARNNHLLVVYTLTPIGNPKDIVKELAPFTGDPIVKSNVDKFYKTNLDKILQGNKIKTVIVTGFAANGAVLHTATSAAFRGYNVIVPVDCISTANILYAEQYTAWHMVNSPGTRNKAVLTKADLISFLH